MWPSSIGALLEPDELAEFQRSFTRVIEILSRFQKRLTPRDVVLLKIGLRASHIEEAMTSGDHERARAHLSALVEMIRNARL
jgi:hypothetical protein